MASRVGIEPTHRAFGVRCVPTSLTAYGGDAAIRTQKALASRAVLAGRWLTVHPRLQQSLCNFQ